MESNGSFGVFYQGVVTDPIFVRLLMQLHFNLHAFVDCLNHMVRLLLGWCVTLERMIVRRIVSAGFIQLWFTCRHVAEGACLPFGLRILWLGVRRRYAYPQQTGGQDRSGNRAL